MISPGVATMRPGRCDGDQQPKRHPGRIALQRPVSERQSRRQRPQGARLACRPPLRAESLRYDPVHHSTARLGGDRRHECAARSPYVAVCVGTRPELIKVWSLFAAAQTAGLSLRLIHTGQHYDSEMDRDIRVELEMPAPAVEIDIGSADHATQTANILTGLESALGHDPPAAVLVQGDTNSALAGALWAAKRAIPVGHVEAGLRSGDRTMPEELNRIVIDHLADWLYAPTETSASNLAREGIPVQSHCSNRQHGSGCAASRYAPA